LYPLNQNLRIIWITPKFPLGTPDGARHATCILLKHLVDFKTKIDLICVLPETEQAETSVALKYLGVSSCCLVRRKDPSLLFNPWSTPYTLRSFMAPETRQNFHEELTRVLASDLRRTTLVIFDGLHPFACLNLRDFQILPRRCAGVVYRAHNYETALWQQSAELAKSPWMRWVYQKQTDLVRLFERQVARNVSLIAAVSEEDALKFKTQAPGTPAVSIPIGMDFPPEEEVALVAPHGSTLDFLFIGRLDWVPNKKGLGWFLEHVWPEVIQRRPHVRLKIAGVGNGRWLDRYVRMPGLNFLGRVGHLETLYRSSALTLAPLFQGSGTRVKILEAARFARPVLSTALGAEGTGLVPGQSYFRAENQTEWIEALSTLTREDCLTVGQRAFRDLRQRFDGRLIAESFINTLHAKLATPPLRVSSTPPQPEDIYVKTG
jgi:glycosyltransferase involved in cell wall biosynthesis